MPLRPAGDGDPDRGRVARPGETGVGLPLGVAALALLCLLPVLGNGFVAWDDPEVLLRNARYRGLSPAHLGWMFTTFHMGHYQPLVWLSFALDSLAWGTDPAGFHLTSLLLHAGNAALCAVLIDRLLARGLGAGAGEARARRLCAAAGALFFALHPLRVEPVAWASDRGDVLAGTTALASLLAYLRAEAERRGAGPWRRWLGLSLAFAAGSLACRGWALTLPAVLLVLDLLVLRRRDAEGGGLPLRALLWEKLPFVAIAVAFAPLAAQAKLAFDPLLFGGALVHGPRERGLQAAWALCFYLVKTALPLSLSPLYPLERQLSPPGALFLLSPWLVAAATAALVALRRRWPAVLAAWLCYVLAVSPALGFGQSGPQIAADRYTYLSCLPWAALASAGLYRLALGRSRALPWVASGAALALLLLGAASAAQSLVWRDSQALWNRAASLHPESGLVHFYRANVRLEAGDLDGAIRDYDRALALGVALAADVHNNRAVAWAQKGDLARARAELGESIRIQPSARAYLNRGLYRAAADPRGAIADWTAALELDPGMAEALHARGFAHQRLGELDAARRDLARALELAPPDWPERAAVERRLRGLAGAGRAGS